MCVQCEGAVHIKLTEQCYLLMWGWVGGGHSKGQSAGKGEERQWFACVCVCVCVKSKRQKGRVCDVVCKRGLFRIKLRETECWCFLKGLGQRARARGRGGNVLLVSVCVCRCSKARPKLSLLLLLSVRWLSVCKRESERI